ncbi:MAG: hypothetical protein WCO60_15985 [Verrucomicrobiota bacterium]
MSSRSNTAVTSLPVLRGPMSPILKCLPILSLLVVNEASFAEAPKAKSKVLEKFNSIDSKTVILNEIKAKIVRTIDPEHQSALEMVGDFHNADSHPSVAKLFPAGTINSSKYSGIRFFAKTENETKIYVTISGPQNKSDARPFVLFTRINLTDVWTEYSIPFSEFRYAPFKVWKDGAQKVYPGGGQIEESELAQIVRVTFWFFIEGRGTDTKGRALIDSLELVEK